MSMNTSFISLDIKNSISSSNLSILNDINNIGNFLKIKKSTSTDLANSQIGNINIKQRNLEYRNDDKKESTVKKVKNTLEFPFSAIGTIYRYDEFDKKYSCGTCTLIRPNVAITVAHNLYMKNGVKVQPNKLKFFLGDNDNKHIDSSEITKFFIPVNYNPKEKDNNYEDYAILILEKNLGYIGGYMGLCSMDSEYNGIKNKKLNLYGYPVAKAKICGEAELYGGEYDNTIFEFKKDNGIIAYKKIYTSDGSSGSPLFYINQNGECFIIGLHKEANKENGNAVLLTKNRFDKINNWIKELNVDIPVIGQIDEMEYHWKNLSKADFNYFFTMNLVPIVEKSNISFRKNSKPMFSNLEENEDFNLDCQSNLIDIPFDTNNNFEFKSSIKLTDLSKDQVKTVLSKIKYLKGFTLTNEKNTSSSIKYSTENIYDELDIFVDIGEFLKNSELEFVRTDKIKSINELEYNLIKAGFDKDFVNEKIIDKNNNSFNYGTNFIRRYYKGREEHNKIKENKENKDELNLLANPKSSFGSSNNNTVIRNYNYQVHYFIKGEINFTPIRKPTEAFLNFFEDKDINDDTINEFFKQYGYLTYESVSLGFKIENNRSELSNYSRFLYIDKNGDTKSIKNENIIEELTLLAFEFNNWYVCYSNEYKFTLELLDENTQAKIFSHCFPKISIYKFVDYRNKYNDKLLNLSDNKLGNESIKYLQFCNISYVRKLNLVNNYFDSESMNYLTACKFKKLLELNLADNYIGSDGLKYLAMSDIFLNLTYLNLNNNNIGSEGIKHISQSEHLTQLRELIGGNNIESEGINHLSKFTKLVHLELKNNNIKNEGLNQFANCKNLNNLKILNLQNNSIDIEGIRHLVKCTFLENIESLNLSKNNIKNNGAKVFSECKFLKKIKLLDLELNEIDKDGEKVIYDSNLFPNITYISV